MEGAKVITVVKPDLLMNEQIKIQRKIKITGKLNTDSSTTNYFETKPTHLFHTEERKICYSPGKCYDVESSVRPESIHKCHMKTVAKSNEIIHKNVNTIDKSVTLFGLVDNLDAEIKVKVKPTENKNQTLRLAKRPCINSSRNASTELSGGQSNTRKDVCENEERKSPSSEDERDESRNHLLNKHEGIKDFIVHSSEEDYNDAMAFQEELLKLGIKDLTVDNFELINPEKSEMESISSLHEQCNTFLLFVTHNYTKDKLRRRQAEMLLLKGLETEGLNHWVVPVWVEKDVKKSILELAPIKGIQYYQLQQNQADFAKQVTDLVRSGRERSVSF